MPLAVHRSSARNTRFGFLAQGFASSIEDVRKYLGEVSGADIDDGFSFDSLDVQLLAHTHMQYPGYSVSVVGHLGKTKTKIFIDVGVGDVVKPTEITMRLLGTDKAPLFEKDIELWAYPVETIFAEKLQTAVARSDQNSRMKDYHDLLCLIRNDVVDLKLVKNAIAETFANRGTKPGLVEINDSEIETTQKYWDAYLRALSAETKQELSPDFKAIIKEVNQYVTHHALL